MIDMTQKQYDEMQYETVQFVSSYKGTMVYENSSLGIKAEASTSGVYYRVEFSPEMNVYDFDIDELSMGDKDEKNG